MAYNLEKPIKLRDLQALDQKNNKAQAALSERVETLETEGGKPGQDGADGTTFIPSVSEDGVLSWTNGDGLPNPKPVDIKGPPGPAGSGAELNVGDGLSKDGDTLVVNTPIRGIFTQAEFDALTKEQQNKGMFIISDGGSSGEGVANGVYSTEETRIGTWIDGKPLYRKVVVFSSPSSSTSATIKIWDFTLSSIFLTNVHAIMINSNGDAIPIPFSETNQIISLIIKGNGWVQMHVSRGEYYSRTVYMTAEYTKKADTGEDT